MFFKLLRQEKRDREREMSNSGAAASYMGKLRHEGATGRRRNMGSPAVLNFH